MADAPMFMPGPFGTARVVVPWPQVPQVEQAVQQAATETGASAEVWTEPTASSEYAAVNVRGKGGGVPAGFWAALAAGLAALGLSAGPGLVRFGEGAAEAVENIGRGVQQALDGLVEGGSILPWLLLGGAAVILLSRR